MMPDILRTNRLVLDLPVVGDEDLIVHYCQDPAFEQFLSIPWPYESRHAHGFLTVVVPTGWASGQEFTWAIRADEGGDLLGLISWRALGGDIGYWIGTPHRGKGYMTEAVIAVTDYVFATQHCAEIFWETRVGNLASAKVARAAGFAFAGEAPAKVASRDGAHLPAWHGKLAAADRGTKSVWPPLT